MTLLAISVQSAQPDFNQQSNGQPVVDGQSYDFTSAQWPEVSFTFPSAGKVLVEIGADLFSEQADEDAYTQVNHRIVAGSGSYATAGRAFAGSGIKVQGSRRTVLYGTPGTTCTLRPTWKINHGSNEWSGISGGQLIIES